MDPFILYRGERDFIAIDLAARIATGDSLTGTPTIEIVAKRGRIATTMESTPVPAIDGTTVEFWVDVPADQARGNYLVRLSCSTANGRVAKEEVPLLVQ